MPRPGKKAVTAEEAAKALRAEALALAAGYTIEEVEAALGISRRTLAGYLRSGKLRGRKVGGRWRIPDSALREFTGAGGGAG